jgi:hypothetical protein
LIGSSGSGAKLGSLRRVDFLFAQQRRDFRAGKSVGKKLEKHENPAGWTIELLAEPEGFEPSIGLYNPITV